MAPMRLSSMTEPHRDNQLPNKPQNCLSLLPYVILPSLLVSRITLQNDLRHALDSNSDFGGKVMQAKTTP